MFWTYMKFESKLLLYNWKNWLIGIGLILFFPLYFSYYSQLDIKNLSDQKREEDEQMMSTFNGFNLDTDLEPNLEAVYNNLTEQSHLINMQRFYLRKEETHNDFIQNGLRLNELRLQLYEYDNQGIPSEYVKPKEEIFKESTLLQYYKEHQLFLAPDPFTASNYMPIALKMISGIIFLLFVLLMGGSMLVHDQEHASVIKGFPISFMRKLHGKVAIHFLQIMFFLVVGGIVGTIYVGIKHGYGNFMTPVLVLQNGTFIAMSNLKYYGYLLIGFALVTLLLLYATVLLNILTKNMYASVLCILGIYYVPDLLLAAGVKADFMQVIKYIDVSYVLSGEAAQQFVNNNLDGTHMYGWLVGLNVLLLVILFGWNKIKKIRKVETAVKVN
ncbi:hypothetical protein [Sporosarcina sp. Te-1]|uniref:hypothetical protein n=1 Tax=Sporosarcina sp. Te-1 TaxID=2818390 RepID=UPI001A9E8CF0|nr:hypothetical protein [Sporosarcina sp. Te-1]QTD41252.1 hypothetical protein J3U78_21455 [Sporosarcina sp. Te-1]